MLPQEYSIHLLRGSNAGRKSIMILRPLTWPYRAARCTLQWQQLQHAARLGSFCSRCAGAGVQCIRAHVPDPCCGISNSEAVHDDSVPIMVSPTFILAPAQSRADPAYLSCTLACQLMKPRQCCQAKPVLCVATLRSGNLERRSMTRCRTAWTTWRHLHSLHSATSCP